MCFIRNTIQFKTLTTDPLLYHILSVNSSKISFMIWFLFLKHFVKYIKSDIFTFICIFINFFKVGFLPTRLRLSRSAEVKNSEVLTAAMCRTLKVGFSEVWTSVILIFSSLYPTRVSDFGISEVWRSISSYVALLLNSLELAFNDAIDFISTTSEVLTSVIEYL